MGRRVKFVEIDIDAFKIALRRAGYESLEEASLGLGRDRTYLTNLFRRKECSIFTLDDVAVKLDRHVSEFVKGDLFDVTEEDWPDVPDE